MHVVSGLFETLRLREGQVPFLERHLARLEQSCRTLGIAPPTPGLDQRLLAEAHRGDAVLRVTLDARGERIEARSVPPSGPMRIVYSGTRHQPYPHKLVDRSVFVRARSRVVPYRADEAILLTDDGLLAEGCVTNVFVWHADTLWTPSLDLGILPGVGRARVLEVAAALGIPVREGHFSRDEALGLPLFLVNAVRGVMETTQHGAQHPEQDDRTRRIAEQFWN